MCLGVLLPAIESGDELPTSLTALDEAVDGTVRRVVVSGGFRAKLDELTVVYPGRGPSRIVLVGMGPGEEVDRNALRRGAAVLARHVQGIGVESASVWVAPEVVAAVGTEAAGQVVAEGLHQGAWRYDGLKSPPTEPVPRLTTCQILVDGELSTWEAGRAIGEAVGLGQSFARDLQILPGNMCTPAFLAKTAEDLAGRHAMRATILDEDALRSEGMLALLGVGQGSAEESRLIVLEYQGAEGAPIVLVGKGVSFDTGGISLKPPLNMEEMKFDMSGAAAVLGAFEALGHLRPKLRVIGLVPSVENMPSGRAIKPGDVIRSHAGKTIEVTNTDAEGRLILADALSYARRFDPAAMIDAATLTGAIVIGLGAEAAGLMGTDDQLLRDLEASSIRAGERVWRLPLWEVYGEAMKSDIADLKNSGGRPAGSITAGWFLKQFVDSTPWAHLDIAGTAYLEKARPGLAKGPTGMATRLFIEFLLARAG